MIRGIEESGVLARLITWRPWVQTPLPLPPSEDPTPPARCELPHAVIVKDRRMMNERFGFKDVP